MTCTHLQHLSFLPVQVNPNFAECCFLDSDPFRGIKSSMLMKFESEDVVSDPHGGSRNDNNKEPSASFAPHTHLCLGV